MASGGGERGRYGWIRDGWVGGWRRVGVADEEEISERSG